MLSRAITTSCRHAFFAGGPPKRAKEDWRRRGLDRWSNGRSLFGLGDVAVAG
jgi:hypothetical protein